jgi:hypothetical protein
MEIRSSTVSRRGLLERAAAVAVAAVPMATVPMGDLLATAADNPDAELLRLIEQWFAGQPELSELSASQLFTNAYLVARDRQWELEIKILEIPAKTFAGLAAKARMAPKRDSRGGWGDGCMSTIRLLDSMARDVLALNAGA